jgi:hypothetical protein
MRGLVCACNLLSAASAQPIFGMRTRENQARAADMPRHESAVSVGLVLLARRHARRMVRGRGSAPSRQFPLTSAKPDLTAMQVEAWVLSLGGINDTRPQHRTRIFRNTVEIAGDWARLRKLWTSAAQTNIVIRRATIAYEESRSLLARIDGVPGAPLITQIRIRD